MTRHLAWYWMVAVAVLTFLATIALVHYFVMPAIWRRILSSAIDDMCASERLLVKCPVLFKVQACGAL